MEAKHNDVRNNASFIKKIRIDPINMLHELKYEFTHTYMTGVNVITLEPVKTILFSTEGAA
jgi:hypothetical protein